ncbi:hypothetical protein ACFSQJ_17895 [Croceitalea marina]|uniref:Lipoprotein n=1 Tax=Croceitalea marina TaxID=1775166 RepID=A0ABW5N3Y6_9FLAO
MKTLLKIFLFLSVLFSITLCTNSSNSDENQEQIIDDDSASQDGENQNPVSDDFSYVILKRGSSDGNALLYEIGNNSGKVKDAGNIVGVGFNIIFNAVTSSSSKVFIYEQNFDPFEGYIHSFDKTTGEVIKTTLEIDKEAFGNSPGLVSMDWDSNRGVLIAIINSEIEFPSGFSKVVEINPVSFEITDLDINLGEFFTTISTTIKNSKLYVSVVEEFENSRFKDFVEIDILNKAFTSLDLENREGALIQLASTNSDNLFFGYSLVFGTQRGNATEPFSLNIENSNYENLLPNIETSNFNNGVKSYFANNQNIIASLTGADGKDLLLQYSIEFNNTDLIELSDFGIAQGGAIIDIRN